MGTGTNDARGGEGDVQEEEGRRGAEDEEGDGGPPEESDAVLMRRVSCVASADCGGEERPYSVQVETGDLSDEASD